jgi:ferric-dicitrate binding protein FerR (iron transport regulator)
MKLTLPAGTDVDEGTAKEVRDEAREATRSVLGLAAVKALELSDLAAEKAQQQARRRRRKYRRTAKKQARKLEKRVTTAAKRLQVAMPVERRRRRGRRTVLFLVVVGGGVAVYLAWRSRQEQGPGEAADAGPASDAFGTAAEHDGDRTRSSTDTTSI